MTTTTPNRHYVIQFADGARVTAISTADGSARSLAYQLRSLAVSGDALDIVACRPLRDDELALYVETGDLPVIARQ